MLREPDPEDPHPENTSASSDPIEEVGADLGVILKEDPPDMGEEKEAEGVTGIEEIEMAEIDIGEKIKENIEASDMEEAEIEGKGENHRGIVAGERLEEDQEAGVKMDFGGN